MASADPATVQLYFWHFFSYPYLPPDFDERYESASITIPNALWDQGRGPELYGQYLDDLAYAAGLGLDGVVLSEHHQSAYSVSPSPNIVAAALSQRIRQGRIAVLGNLLPLRLNPLRVAEEYALLDNLTDGRLVAGFAIGGGQECFNYNVSPTRSTAQFWEGADLVVRAWTEPGPFAHDGQHYPLRYVNPWPRPRQLPHPPVWMPAPDDPHTLARLAARGFGWVLARPSVTRARSAATRYHAALTQAGRPWSPARLSALLLVFVGDSDESARRVAEPAVWSMLRDAFKGHLRRRGRVLTSPPGFASLHARSLGPLAGDARSWAEVEQMDWIMIGGPARVTAALRQYVEAGIGNLLIQFHFGTLSSEATRRSVELFMARVAPALREASTRAFAAAGAP